MNLDSYSKPVHYISFIAMFILAQASSMWGQYFTLKYPNMGMIEAFLRAIPFAWLDWAFMSVAVYIGDRYKLVTPTQDTLLLIIIQFVSILVINSLWLGQAVSKSDIFCFFIILLAFYISFSNIVSKTLGIKVPKKKETKKEDKDDYEDISQTAIDENNKLQVNKCEGKLNRDSRLRQCNNHAHKLVDN